MVGEDGEEVDITAVEVEDMVEVGEVEEDMVEDGEEVDVVEADKQLIKQKNQKQKLR
jgi:hypothetical protein